MSDLRGLRVMVWMCLVLAAITYIGIWVGIGMIAVSGVDSVAKVILVGGGSLLMLKATYQLWYEFWGRHV